MRITTLALTTAAALTLGGCTTPTDSPNEAIAQAPTPAAETAPAAQTNQADPLQAAIAGNWRDPANTARDQYRHPRETLQFFQLEPTQTVVEVTPGGGWYAEILAPYLRAGGNYVAAVVDPMAVPADAGRDYHQKSRTALEAKFAAAPAQFDQVKLVTFDPEAPVLGSAGSADRVLTFRNVHNWLSSGGAEAMFKAFFAVLKPSGVLGVVEHRAKGEVAADDKSGYVGQAQVIALAAGAGFKLQETSEVNANPKDSKDHPEGVWMLPPSNRHPAADAAKYQAIGESDRMTLRFVKP